MFKSLEVYPPDYVTGVLARFALKRRNKNNPAGVEISSEEHNIRKSILEEIDHEIKNIKDEEERVTKVLEAIDKELELFTVVKDSKKIMLRLAEKAELPSDLYQINVIPNIREFYGKKYESEYKRIIETVHNPDKEQHFGPSENREEPALISIFSKYYKAEFPRNCFHLIVVGQRNELRFEIHQVWRIYPDSIRQENYANLIDILKEFANAFGVDIDVDGKIGKFFLAYNKEKKEMFNIVLHSKIKTQKGKPVETSFTFSHFVQNNQPGEYKQASLIIAIDLIKYKNFLKQHDWK